jgi:hypothetical protein
VWRCSMAARHAASLAGDAIEAATNKAAFSPSSLPAAVVAFSAAIAAAAPALHVGAPAATPEARHSSKDRGTLLLPSYPGGSLMPSSTTSGFSFCQREEAVGVGGFSAVDTPRNAQMRRRLLSATPTRFVTCPRIDPSSCKGMESFSLIGSKSGGPISSCVWTVGWIPARRAGAVENTAGSPKRSCAPVLSAAEGDSTAPAHSVERGRFELYRSDGASHGRGRRPWNSQDRHDGKCQLCPTAGQAAASARFASDCVH